MRIAIATLGCKINQFDSAVIQERLRAPEHHFVPFEERADFYIINSCTVTDRADWEARQLVRRAKRLNEQARILMTGCYAQVQPQEVSRLPGVDFVVGLNRLDDLLRFVVESGRGGDAKEVKLAIGDVRREREVQVSGANLLPGHTRAFLKVQEGCDFSCTYCIIPIARGRSRSVSPDEVLRQIAALAAQGMMEVVLTGVHLGGYGRDRQPRTDLTALLQKIADSGLLRRLRLSSLDPREVPDRLLKLIASSEVLCDHLHVCLQAGEDRILKEMRRNYDTGSYRSLIDRARELLPDASLGSDVIVGFPGESEEDFSRSLEFLESLPLTYYHVFPYSVRKGTMAASLPDQVAPQVKRKRARRVRDLAREKKRAFYQRFIGRRVPVLVERASREPRGWFKGYSRNYLPVCFSAPENQMNREVQVAIEGLEGEWLRGRIVEGGAP